MRYFTNRESYRVKSTTDDFEDVPASSMLYCLGMQLSYHRLKKYEDMESLNFSVRMTITLQEAAIMKVTINDRIEFNDDIPTENYHKIMSKLDALMNDIDASNNENESDNESESESENESESESDISESESDNESESENEISESESE